MQTQKILINYEKGVWTLPPSLRLKDKDKEKYLEIGESDRMTLLFKKPLVNYTGLIIFEIYYLTLYAFLVFSIFSFADNYDEQTICLAQNIYHEARGEIIDGQIGQFQMLLLIELNLNNFLNDICSVVYQRNQIAIIDRVLKFLRIPAFCQFSWTCDLKSNDSYSDLESWNNSLTLAQKIILDSDDLTNGATHYYNPDKVPTPSWANKLTKTIVIGNHHFYK